MSHFDPPCEARQPSLRLDVNLTKTAGRCVETKQKYVELVVILTPPRVKLFIETQI